MPRPVGRRQVATPAAVARRQAGPLPVSAGPAGGRGSVSRGRGRRAPILGAALALAGRLRRHSSGVGGHHFGQGRRGREMHLCRLAVGEVQRPDGEGFGLHLTLSVFRRSRRSRRSAQCWRGFCRNVSQNARRSRRSALAFQCGEQVIKRHRRSPRAVHRRVPDTCASCARRWFPALRARRVRSPSGSRRPVQAHQAPG